MLEVRQGRLPLSPPPFDSALHSGEVTTGLLATGRELVAEFARAPGNAAAEGVKAADRGGHAGIAGRRKGTAEGGESRPAVVRSEEFDGDPVDGATSPPGCGGGRGQAACFQTLSLAQSRRHVGYKLNITKESNTFNLERTMDIVRETAPESRVEEDKQDAVTISLNTLECKNFGAMFRALEKLQPQLGFGDIGVRVASMKDAYTRINTDWVPGECRRDSMDGKRKCTAAQKLHTKRIEERSWSSHS
ncbi:hypothetical protein HPB48_005287 [Haemaphysalis longicornis]|uniref:Uncharacterized protein n=1 Tax=Haemaphysalis longicornis TaxID=44386 RepID=A0A9J6GTP7_HAELO|nr:hypothetical protein HPB48_005287 [Haemaphysalis longicornis]